MRPTTDNTALPGMILPSMTSAQDSRLISLEIHSQDSFIFNFFAFLIGMVSPDNIFEVWINRASIKHRFSGQDYKTIRKSFATHLSSRTNK